MRIACLLIALWGCSAENGTQPDSTRCDDACGRLTQCGMGCNAYTYSSYSFCRYENSQFSYTVPYGYGYDAYSPYGYGQGPDFSKCLTDCRAYAPTFDRDYIVGCILAAPSCSDAFACGM